MWMSTGFQTWGHLGCTRNGFWQRLGQVVPTRPEVLMAVNPFLSSDTEFLDHFSNPSVSKKLPSKALEMVMQVLEAYRKKFDCCFDSLFQYSRAQGYPMIPEYRWIHGSMGVADVTSRGCRDVSSTFSTKP